MEKNKDIWAKSYPTYCRGWESEYLAFLLG